MKLGLDFIKTLQDADHWEIIEDMSKRMILSGQAIKNFHSTLDHIGEAREEILKEMALFEVYKDIIQMKLCMRGEEWSQEISQAVEIVKKQYVRKNIDTISVPSTPSIPEGLI